jgi:3-oxoacyl-[acyl-carrier-protein] synthase II
MHSVVVVTGIGVVTPIGIGPVEFWKNLLDGRCGIDDVRSFDTSAYPSHRGAEVKHFEPAAHIRVQDPKTMGRASQFAIAAARMALADSGMDIEALAPEHTGVSMGTTSGEPQMIEQYDDCHVTKQLEGVRPEFIRKYPCSIISAHIAAEFGLEGPNITIPAACAAGNHAIAFGLDTIRSGSAEVMLAGGSDCFSRITYTGFARLGAIAPDTCRPFDRNRKGMIPGEGAAVLVLESLDHARNRNARVYAEVVSYGLSCDAHHMTAGHPSGDGAVRAMEMALAEANIAPDEVSYISAHGTGTSVNDRIETAAVKRVFGERAHQIPISSIKSMLGHTMGAASAIESAACALSIFNDRIPPTINLDEPDPECDLDYVPNRARDQRVQVAMNNAYAFGGNNASVLFRKCEANI